MSSYKLPTLTLTGSLVSPNAAGVLLFASGSGKRVKVYSAGYYSPASTWHFFYFGNTTAPTANRFLVGSGSGAARQTFITPVMSNVNQSLYYYDSGSAANTMIDVGYVVDY
jgi:hypothetical protein